MICLKNKKLKFTRTLNILALTVSLVGVGGCMLEPNQLPPGLIGVLNEPSIEEITKGLKEALVKGSTEAALKASSADGFLGNLAIKILLPQEVVGIEKFARDIGLGKFLDDLIIQMNRSAELASQKAGPIFINAVTSMTFDDAMGILTGGNSSATNYLRSKTYISLKAAFSPDIRQAMNQFQVANVWEQFATNYNRIPLVQPVTIDLPGHITEKALDGLFFYLAQEEQLIRKDPIARTTEILKKVFGFADQKK